jgi:hypothetical protein
MECILTQLGYTLEICVFKSSQRSISFQYAEQTAPLVFERRSIVEVRFQHPEKQGSSEDLHLLPVATPCGNVSGDHQSRASSQLVQDTRKKIQGASFQAQAKHAIKTSNFGPHVNFGLFPESCTTIKTRLTEKNMKIQVVEKL